MCRIFAYLGPEIPLENLLLNPRNSLLNQSKAPEHHPLMQLSGWGFSAWSESFHHPDRPLTYRRPVPAFFDDNAKRIIPSLRCHTALAHVRATSYRAESVLADENCHPFLFDGTPWALVHNGFVPAVNPLKRELFSQCERNFLRQMRGTTDTEFVYTLLLSQLKDDSIEGFAQAFREVLKLIVEALRSCELLSAVKLKLALATPHSLVAVNYGCGFEGEYDIQGDWQELRERPLGSQEFLLSTVLEPLYLLTGQNFDKYGDSYDVDPCEHDQATTAVLASEPLTHNKEHWTEIPFGSILRIDRVEGAIRQEISSLEL